MGLFSLLKEGFLAVKKIITGVVRSVYNAVSGAVTTVKTVVQNLFVNFVRKAQSFLQVVVNKLKNIVKGVLVGAQHLLRRTADGLQQISRNFSVDQNLGKWHATTVTEKIDESEVPPEMLAKANSKGEVNTTPVLENALAC